MDCWNRQRHHRSCSRNILCARKGDQYDKCVCISGADDCGIYSTDLYRNLQGSQRNLVRLHYDRQDGDRTKWLEACQCAHRNDCFFRLHRRGLGHRSDKYYHHGSENVHIYFYGKAGIYCYQSADSKEPDLHRLCPGACDCGYSLRRHNAVRSRHRNRSHKTLYHIHPYRNQRRNLFCLV